MCQRISCSTCGKPTWSGCGEHIEEALAGVPESERCSCARSTKSGGFFSNLFRR